MGTTGNKIQTSGHSTPSTVFTRNHSDKKTSSSSLKSLSVKTRSHPSTKVLMEPTEDTGSVSNALTHKTVTSRRPHQKKWLKLKHISLNLMSLCIFNDPIII